MNRVNSAQSQAASGTDCWGQSYGYDRYGNLLTASVTKCSAPTLSLTVNGSNQITNGGFGYDAAGNMTAADGNTFAFDAENRTSSVAGVNYTYDGDGWRVKKSNGELDWYDASGTRDLMAETDLSGNTTAEYLFMDSVLIAKRDTSGNIFYNFGDRIASNREMTDSTGVVKHESDYYPFGVERPIVTTLETKHKFTGKKRDTETSLDYSHFRMFDSNRGRWTSPDPSRCSLGAPQLLNRYNYVGNNPGNFIDPQGDARYCAECEATVEVTATPEPVFTIYNPINVFMGGVENRGWRAERRDARQEQIALRKEEKKKKYNNWLHTNWCGPGGSGPTLNKLDEACKRHDECYDKYGLKWIDNNNPWLSADKKRHFRECNQTLCNEARQTSDYGSKRLVQWFQENGFYRCQ